MHDGVIGAWEVRRHLPNIQGTHGLTCMDPRDGSRDFGKRGEALYQRILLYRGGSRVFNWGEERQWEISSSMTFGLNFSFKKHIFQKKVG